MMSPRSGFFICSLYPQRRRELGIDWAAPADRYPAGRGTFSDRRRHRYRLLAWSVLVFNVFVILGGAIVRATESGDGCGASWPTCTDRIFPSNPAVETVIEFSHRITSAFAILGVLALYVRARCLYARGHRVRLAAGVALYLMGVEALLGASLVSSVGSPRMRRSAA